MSNEPNPSPSAADPTDPADPADPSIVDPPADPSGDPPSDPAAYPSSDAWGADWREKHAGDDEKLLKRLQRYTDPGALINATVAAQNKIASGDLKTALPENATDEEKGQWREDNGIPATAADYSVELAGGLVIGEEDQPIVDSFLESAHATNMHPSQVNDALGWYMEHQGKMAEAQDESDEASRAACEDSLRAEWEGGEYRTNVNLANNMLDSAPEGLKENIMGGRMADGTPIGNSPDMIRFLASQARELNPIATIVPGAGEGAMNAITTEMGELRTLMGDRSSKYWKGPESKQLQARYKELVSAQQKYG